MNKPYIDFQLCKDTCVSFILISEYGKQMYKLYVDIQVWKTDV